MYIIVHGFDIKYLTILKDEEGNNKMFPSYFKAEAAKMELINPVIVKVFDDKIMEPLEVSRLEKEFNDIMFGVNTVSKTYLRNQTLYYSGIMSALKLIEPTWLYAIQKNIAITTLRKNNGKM